MIKHFYALFLSITLLSFSLSAAAEKVKLTKKEIFHRLSLNNSSCNQTIFDLCAGKITIEPTLIWDCAGIAITTHDEYDDFVEILSNLSKQEILDLSARTNVKGHSLLHLLVLTEKIDFIKALLLYSINIDSIDKEGNTPLHFAAKKNNLEIIRLLIQHGASENIKNNADNTPADLLKGDFFLIHRLQTEQTPHTNSAIYDSWMQDLINYPFDITHKFNTYLNTLADKNFLDMYYADENQEDDALDESIEGY